MLEIWIAKTQPQELQRLEAVLSDDEQARCSSIRIPDVRDQYVVAHALKRLSIANLLGARDPRRLRFARLSHGKPVLLDGPLNFNLSHSRGICAIVLSTFGPCGIDIETHRLNRPLASALLRSMTLEEQRDIETADDPYTAFIKRWVLKEAYSKVSGLGLAEPFGQLCTKREIDWRNGEFGYLRNTNIWRRNSADHAIAMCATGCPGAQWCHAAQALPQTELGELVAQGFEFTGAFAATIDGQRATA
ncbi:MAG: 4'-phosphopantetheinyl transferase family protein [Methyloligella sp. ZOD6]